MRNISVIFKGIGGQHTGPDRIAFALFIGMMLTASLGHGQSLDRDTLPSEVSAPAASSTNHGRSGKDGPTKTSSPPAPTTTGNRVVITDEGVASAYGAPAAFSRSRFANLTNAYVLPAWNMYTALIYEGGGEAVEQEFFHGRIVMAAKDGEGTARLAHTPSPMGNAGIHRKRLRKI